MYSYMYVCWLGGVWCRNGTRTGVRRIQRRPEKPTTGSRRFKRPTQVSWRNLFLFYVFFFLLFQFVFVIRIDGVNDGPFGFSVCSVIWRKQEINVRRWGPRSLRRRRSKQIVEIPIKLPSFSDATFALWIRNVGSNFGTGNGWFHARSDEDDGQ